MTGAPPPAAGWWPDPQDPHGTLRYASAPGVWTDTTQPAMRELPRAARPEPGQNAPTGAELRGASAPWEGLVPHQGPAGDPSRYTTEREATQHKTAVRRSFMQRHGGSLMIGVGVLFASFAVYESVLSNVFGNLFQGDEKTRICIELDLRCDEFATQDARVEREPVRQQLAAEEVEARTSSVGYEDPTLTVPLQVNGDPLTSNLDMTPEEIAEAAIEEIPVEQGEAWGLIRIPAIGVASPLIVGTTAEDLDAGPGWHELTAQPGEAGNTLIAGHRTTYGAPFARLDELVDGDLIHIHLNRGDGRTEEIIYEVRTEERFIVEPTDVWVAGRTEGARLTLQSCSNGSGAPGSASHRIIVQAELIQGPAEDLAIPRDQWQVSTPPTAASSA